MEKKTRRTRAHPSPSGFTSLPEPTRKPRAKSNNKATSSKTVSQERVEDVSTDASADAPEEQSVASPKPTAKRARSSDKEPVEQPVKRTRTNRSKQVIHQNLEDSSSEEQTVPSYVPSTTPYNNNDGNEAEIDEERPTQTQAAASPTSPLLQRKLRAPKSPKAQQSKHAALAEPKSSVADKSKDMMPNNIIERERMYMARWGRPMPKATYGRKVPDFVAESVHLYGRSSHLEEEEEEELPGIDEEYLGGPSHTYEYMARFRNDPATYRRDKFPFEIPPQSTDSPEVSPTRKGYTIATR
jgi:hypothetical protein